MGEDAVFNAQEAAVLLQDGGEPFRHLKAGEALLHVRRGQLLHPEVVLPGAAQDAGNDLAVGRADLQHAALVVEAL